RARRPYGSTLAKTGTRFMQDAADVRSLDALRDFHTSMCVFRADAMESLASIELAIRKAQDWLAEQAQFWQRAIRASEEEVFQAKQELAMRKFPGVSGRPPDTTVQEENLRKAKAKLAHAQEKLEITRKWVTKFPVQVSESYAGPGRQLLATLESDLPKGLAMLERRVIALEEYLALKAPPAPNDVSAPPPPPPVLPETPV
ncbi:MAG TPA: hypothetical protein VGZ47_06140, partial [Gemmataceae bacterium]|nr:hypothetical protein [Gemmataceae bacterium]